MVAVFWGLNMFIELPVVFGDNDFKSMFESIKGEIKSFIKTGFEI